MASCLKNPVVLEDASEKVREGAPAVPSSIFIFALSIDESAPLTVMPPLKVAMLVKVAVEVTPKVPVIETFPELVNPVKLAKPDELILHVAVDSCPSGLIKT